MSTTNVIDSLPAAKVRPPLEPQPRTLGCALSLFAVFAIPVLILGSVLFNLAMCKILQTKYPVPGTFYQVNGRAMHIDCTGQGYPMVLLESGAGSSWLYWQKVQPEVAKFTRICSYDRAGLGWSDLQPGSRDAKNIAAQLHSLLLAAGETGPLVLVGHSAGGFYIREFVSDYPRSVAGLIFVDASTPEQFQALPAGKDSDAKRQKRHRQAALEWIKEASGWSRLSGQCNNGIISGLESYGNLVRAENCRPSFAASWLGESDEFWHSGEEAANANCCSDLPILIISRDPQHILPGWTAKDVASMGILNRLQEQLKKLSPRSRRIIARNSRHPVMLDRPDVVIGGIRQMVEEARTQVSYSQYGTTVIQ